MDSKDKHKKEEEEEEEEDDDDEEEEEEEEEDKNKEKKKTPKVAFKEEKITKEESKKKGETEIDPDSDEEERMFQRKKSPKSEGAAKIIDQDKQKDGSDDLSEDVEQMYLSENISGCPLPVPRRKSLYIRDLKNDLKALQLEQENEKEVFPTAADKPINIIRNMWDTVLDHERGYIEGHAKTTYLVCTINGEPDRICIKNKDGTHAEEQLTVYLEAKYIATPNVTCTITVYINNSPCHMCAQKLKEFLQKFENIELVLYVTHLYNIRRLSCQLNWERSFQKKDRHMGYIDVNDYEKNYQGLKDLINLGENCCRIDAFTEDVWKALHGVMGIEEELKHKYTKTTNGDDVRSRNREDLNITQDLTYLRENSDPWQKIAKIKYYKTN